MTKPILIVEDDADGQALVAHICEFLKIEHDLANDAERAVQLIYDEGRDYGVIIIDLALPGADGWQLLAHIRQQPATATTTCIAITGYHTSRTREEALQAGFDAYFAKPLDPTRFARELETWL